ncbi:MAG: GGDEF domain-containing protein [Spirochaetaceae bacterium]|jgi:diguanylate cyclase (GGDEF)-like protein|nr:GGDEF domain-containing protein [Spirochaetaceae bacterium]
MTGKLFANHILALLDVINTYDLGLWEMENNMISLDQKTRELIAVKKTAPMSLDDFIELVEPGDRHELAGTLQRLLENPGQSACVECRVLAKKDKSYRWLRIMGKSYLSQGKKILLGTSQPVEGKVVEYLTAKINAMTGELDKKAQLNQCIFEITEVLLNTDDAAFEQAFQSSLKSIAAAFALARVYLYKNHLVDGVLCCTEIHEWSEGVDPTLGEDFTKDIPLHAWPKVLEQGQNYTGLIKDTPQQICDLIPRGIGAILLIPVFLKDLFWGFVGFERIADCPFSKDEELALGSVALLLANSVIRFDLNKNLYLAIDKINTTSIRAEVLERFAYTDALTGLYNRRHFMELAQSVIEKAKRFESPCYAMILDLDFFKKVNDTYGHLAGDEVLKGASLVMKNTLRSYDLLARYGGEEFVVLISDTSEDAVLHLANRIRESIAHTVFVHNDAKMHCTVSIGVAENFPSSTVSSLLEKADRALYTAKESGRNQVVMSKD